MARVAILSPTSRARTGRSGHRQPARHPKIGSSWIGSSPISNTIAPCTQILKGIQVAGAAGSCCSTTPTGGSTRTATQARRSTSNVYQSSFVPLARRWGRLGSLVLPRGFLQARGGEDSTASVPMHNEGWKRHQLARRRQHEGRDAPCINATSPASQACPCEAPPVRCPAGPTRLSSSLPRLISGGDLDHAEW